MSAPERMDLLKYADTVLTGTGIAAVDIRTVVASAAGDAATRALRAGWNCATDAPALVVDDGAR